MRAYVGGRRLRGSERCHLREDRLPRGAEPRAKPSPRPRSAKLNSEADALIEALLNKIARRNQAVGRGQEAQTEGSTGEHAQSHEPVEERMGQGRARPHSHARRDEGQHATPSSPARRYAKRAPARRGSICAARLKRRSASSLRAVAEGVSINEIFSRMLALYEREHGRVELSSDSGAMRSAMVESSPDYAMGCTGRVERWRRP